MDLQDWSQHWYQFVAICGVALTFTIGGLTVWLLFRTLDLNRKAMKLNHDALELNRQGQELARQSQELTRQSKQSDVTREFNSRYSRAWEMQYKPEIKADPIPYYERFWNLQFDQFNAWRDGFVSDEIYKYWLTNRHTDWLTNKPIGSISYQDGFAQTVPTWSHTPFQEFMNTLHKRGVDPAIEWARVNP